MGRVWEWNSNREATHFLENVFLTSWASKCLERHAHPVVHPSVFLSHTAGAPVHFPSQFWLIDPFFPWLEICFGYCWMYVELGSRFWGCWVYVHLGKPVFGFTEWRSSRYLCFGGLRGCFPFPHSAGIWWASSSQFFVFSSFYPSWKLVFFVKPSSWEDRSTFWVWMEVMFVSMKPLNVFWNDLITWVDFHHLSFSILVFKAFLSIRKTCILLCSASLCWLGWESPRTHILLGWMCLDMIIGLT